MYNFVYDIPTKVYFGNNQLSNLGKELKKYGNRVLLCYGGGSIKRIGLYDQVIKEIKDAGLELFELSGIEPNPRVESVNEGGNICKEKNIDVLLAVGGGSVIDCTKFIGAAKFYDGDAWDLVTRKAPITDCLPIVSILTLAATGSEMDDSGVITNLKTNDKIGMGAPCLRPKVSFLAPQNTYSVPTYQTACGSVDIISHILEAYFIPGGSMYMLDKFMEGMIKTVVKYAPIAMNKTDDEEARANLMWTSSWAINDFVGSCQNCNWSCHPIEHQLSAYYDITHGLGLAIVTPRWLRYVLDESTAPKIKELGVNVFDLDKSASDMEGALATIGEFEKFFFETLGLTSNLTELGIDETHFEDMAKKVCGSKGVLKGYKHLIPSDVVSILRNCL